MADKKLTLKEAREKNKLDDFIKEHEKDAPGDADKLDKTLCEIAKGEKKKPKQGDS